MNNPYEELANAIVMQAVKDYKTALKYHFCHPNKTEYARKALHLERFFHSSWYKMLTKLDGEQLINGVRRKVRAEVMI